MAGGKIIFVHEGKAAYPEVAAYRRFLAADYETREVHPDELAGWPDLADSIVWMIMGFYPRRPRAAVVIHDYRSLSVGRARGLKDRVKRHGNARPDLRIFQNEALAGEMGFGPEVPSLLIPMGVPESVLEHRGGEPEEAAVDFCYVGAMSRERRTHLMFDSFLARFGDDRSFHAYGAPDAFIRRRYENHANIVFPGRRPQEEVFSALSRARVAVNFFPTHLPHALQTPTKLLEYAALGLRILGNEQRQSRQTCERLGIESRWGTTEDLFADVPEVLDWPANEHFDPTPILWSTVLEESGLAAALAGLGGRA
jgi:glycosyltransferase involved in cell wall biosynthesis